MYLQSEQPVFCFGTRLEPGLNILSTSYEQQPPSDPDADQVHGAHATPVVPLQTQIHLELEEPFAVPGRAYSCIVSSQEEQ